MKGLVLDAKWDPKPDYKLSDFERSTGKAITGSSVWRDPKLEVREWEMPKPGDNDVLIKVKACGVCGSDMHFYETDEDNYILYPGLTKFPTILGHEFSGQVVEVGKRVNDLKVGDMVTVEEMMWCGRCKPCRAGFPNHCTNLEELGFTIPGADAEYIAVDAKYCWKLDELKRQYSDDETIYEVGATVEPTSVAYNSIFVRGQGFQPGAYFVVFGVGPIGLAAIQLARSAGASLIIAFEVSKGRLELARKLGVDYAFHPDEIDTSPGQVVMDLTHGEGADFILEAAGVPEFCILEAEKCLAVNGKISQIGRAADRVPMYIEVLQVRRGQLFGSQGHSGHNIFPNVIRMMAAGLVDNTKIITARFPLDKAVDAIAQSTSRQDGKIIIKPE